MVYLVVESQNQESPTVPASGKHKIGKSCLYFKRLADLDTKVLEALVAGS